MGLILVTCIYNAAMLEALMLRLALKCTLKGCSVVSSHHHPTMLDLPTIKEALDYVIIHGCGARDQHSLLARDIKFTTDDERIFEDAILKYIKDNDKRAGWDPLAHDGDWAEMLQLAGMKSKRIYLAHMMVVYGLSRTINVMNCIEDPELQAIWRKICPL